MPVSTASIKPAGAGDSRDLKFEVEYRTKLQDICNKIFAAKNLDEILINLKDEITGLFEAQRITVYVVHGKTRELVSRFKSGDEIGEIRIPVATTSLSGFSAARQKRINIHDVYNADELAAIDPALKFDSSWDKKTGFRTRQVLVFPIIYKKFLLGAIQLINRKSGDAFTKLDEEAVEKLAEIVGIALYNQKRMASVARPTKFDHILENHILTQKELDKAILDSRQRKEPIETVLIREFKVAKADILKSLSKYYRIPSEEYNATTPIDPDVLRAMMPFLKEEFGNPSSGYALGQQARKAMDQAREDVAALLDARPCEIVFTSGGSESNNMVLKGIVDLTRPQACHIITAAIEHPAILNPALYLMELGVRVTILSVDRFGQVDPDDLGKAITPGTVLITLMLANNETGTLQPIREIVKVARAHGIPVHTDAAQAVGKIPVDVEDLGVDFLTVAGHKLYAPKGVGALYMREGRSLTPLIHGAAQENGRRAGTENVALATGLGAACRMASQRLQEDSDRISRLRNRLQDLLFEGTYGLVLNGHPQERLPNTLNVSVPHLEGGKVLDAVPLLMASTGAACHDRTVKLSHVLSAMHVPPEIGMGALRLTLGRGTTLEEVDRAARLLIGQVHRMRNGR